MTSHTCKNLFKAQVKNLLQQFKAQVKRLLQQFKAQVKNLLQLFKAQVKNMLQQPKHVKNLLQQFKAQVKSWVIFQDTTQSIAKRSQVKNSQRLAYLNSYITYAVIFFSFRFSVNRPDPGP